MQLIIIIIIIIIIVTEKQHVLVLAVYDSIGKWQHTKSYKILFHKTQPAHILMLIAVTTIAMLLNPLKNKDLGGDVERELLGSGAVEWRPSGTDHGSS